MLDIKVMNLLFVFVDINYYKENKDGYIVNNY